MNSIKTKKLEDGVRIYLSGSFERRQKVLFFVYSIVFLFPALAYTWVILNEDIGLDPTILIIVILIVAFFIAFYRFGKSATLSEYLEIYDDKIRIVKKSLFGTDSRYFELSKISNFQHLKKPELSDHPLKGESFDYFGFQTDQIVINEMHGDNRLSFNYGNETITFGKNIYSWHFEEIESLIKGISRIDE